MWLWIKNNEYIYKKKSSNILKILNIYSYMNILSTTVGNRRDGTLF